MTLETQYNEFLFLNSGTDLSFNEWKEVHGNEIKQALINMMEKDEELGLYDYGWCKGNVVLPKEETKLEDVFNDEKKENIKKFIDKHKQELDCPFDFTSRCTMGRCDCKPVQRLEKYSERFDNKNNQIVEGVFNPDTWGKRLVEEKNVYIGPFLLRNGFTKYKLENNIYANPKCTINVLEDCYEVLFESEYGEVSTYTDSHSIIHLVGILTWNDLIDKNYNK